MAIDYFGGCPRCPDGKNDGYLNIWRANWFVCHTHRVKWCVGDNMFRSWRDESEEIWRTNARRIADYKEVKPVYK
jgi:hypothetical protein